MTAEAIRPDETPASLLAGIVRNAVMDARNAGETIYTASEEAAQRILATFPVLRDPDDSALRASLERLLEKWHADRAEYPEQSFGAPWAATAVKLCENELRHALGDV